MDLAAAANQIRLDILAVEVSKSLYAAHIPHVVLKGPSTANWLYRPARSYRDVDLLVPATRFREAVTVISAQGLAFASAGRVGEEGAHSLVMLSPSGFELDLHLTLPMLSPRRYRDPDRVWEVFGNYVVTMALIDEATIPVLDIPGRCLVLALHSLASGYQSEQAREDLRRARSAASGSAWHQAAAIAEALDILDLFQAGIAVVEPDNAPAHPSVDAFLKRSDAGGVAFGLQRLAEAPLSTKPGIIWGELFPSPAFMRRAFPVQTSTRRGFLAAYVQRWKRLSSELLSGARAWRRAKAAARSSD